MLNYISAELYKLGRKKSLIIGLTVLLVLESLFFVPGFWVDAVLEKNVLLSFLDGLLPMGLFLAPVFAVLAFDNQHGYATLKNEVVFGIPKSRIYLGKLLTAMLVGTVAAALVLGWYLLLCMLTVGPLVEASLWAQFLINVTSAWLTWLSALSFAMCLLFSLGSSTMAMVVAYLVAFLGVPVGILGADNSAALWVRLSVNLFYSAPYHRFWFWFGEVYSPGFGPPLDWSPLRYALVVWCVWMGIFTAIGLLRFRRREIK